MGADFSRLRDNPLLDFCSVEMQQGKVLLDSDWNALSAILDRRFRAAAADTLGRATVPSTTPLAFQILATGGDITIGPGRMYVDGLLAENHGLGKGNPLDPVLAEVQHLDAIGYHEQPYHPVRPALPGGGPHLFYLEVWQREVSHVEIDGLVEQALGVETTSRRQTAWQVRFLPNVPDKTNCAMPDAKLGPRWLRLIAPSAGRLSSGPASIDAKDDPCELPLLGGYRGLENQLYRVEVHQGGVVGKATFKWSRNNASVASRVARYVSPTRLELETLGRDEVLCIKSGDWVEILHDGRELSGIDGDPALRYGEMRQVTVDEAASTIEFAEPLQGDMLPVGATDLKRQEDIRKRRFRVRRWEDDAVLIKELDKGVPLGKEGVQVRFSLEPESTDFKEFRAGDYWLFAARTADLSVERLDKAPPRGAHRHFARLAVVNFPDFESDCRSTWPPNAAADCGCTVCVTPESHASGRLTVQLAVNKLRATGGTVCLAPGAYSLKEPVLIEDAKFVRIRGHGAATMLSAPDTAFSAANCASVTIEDLAVFSQGMGASAVRLRNCIGARLERLSILVYGAFDMSRPAIGMSGLMVGVQILDNFVRAASGVAALASGKNGEYLLGASLRIEDNILWCDRAGVSLRGACALGLAVRVSGNEIVGCSEAAIRVAGASLEGLRLEIARNTINTEGDGIAASSGARIEGNQVEGRGKDPRNAIALLPGLDPDGSSSASVAGNGLRKMGGAGVAVHAVLASLEVAGNIVEGCGSGILFDDKGSADTLLVENNRLSDIAAGPGARGNDAVGMQIAAARHAVVTGNTVHRVGTMHDAAGRRIGIYLLGCAQARISGNDIGEIGPQDGFLGSTEGIQVEGPFEHTAVSDNVVRRGAFEEESKGEWFALKVRPAMLPVSTKGMIPVVAKKWAFVLPAGKENVSVRGNAFEAGSEGSVVAIQVNGDCLFNDNHCSQLFNIGAPVVQLKADCAVVNSNRVRSENDGRSIQIDVPYPQNLSIVGNIVAGDIRLVHTPGALLMYAKPPLGQLNVIAS